MLWEDHVAMEGIRGPSRTDCAFIGWFVLGGDCNACMGSIYRGEIYMRSAFGDVTRKRWRQKSCQLGFTKGFWDFEPTVWHRTNCWKFCLSQNFEHDYCIRDRPHPLEQCGMRLHQDTTVKSGTSIAHHIFESFRVHCPRADRTNFLAWLQNSIRRLWRAFLGKYATPWPLSRFSLDLALVGKHLGSGHDSSCCCWPPSLRLFARLRGAALRPPEWGTHHAPIHLVTGGGKLHQHRRKTVLVLVPVVRCCPWLPWCSCCVPSAVLSANLKALLSGSTLRCCYDCTRLDSAFSAKGKASQSLKSWHGVRILAGIAFRPPAVFGIKVGTYAAINSPVIMLLRGECGSNHL